jgi:hypothetical protein
VATDWPVASEAWIRKEGGRLQIRRLLLEFHALFAPR